MLTSFSIEKGGSRALRKVAGMSIVDAGSPVYCRHFNGRQPSGLNNIFRLWDEYESSSGWGVMRGIKISQQDFALKR